MTADTSARTDDPLAAEGALHDDRTIFGVGPGIWIWRTTVLLGILGLWKAASLWWIDPFWIGDPAEVAATIADWFARGTIWIHLWNTIWATLISFALGTALGVVTGIVLGLNNRLALVLDPFIGAFYSLPKVALAPLFILWFGIGIESKIALATFGVFFLIFYNTYSGTRSVDSELVDVLRLMGARRGQIIRKVVVPSALYWIFTGMRVSIPYAMIGVVVAEMMASNKGIGYLIQAAAGQFNTSGVFAALFVLVAISVILQSTLKRMEKAFIR